METNHSFGAKRYRHDITEERKKKISVSELDSEFSGIYCKNNNEMTEIVLSFSTDKDVSVIPISVTQAQWIYNDERVVKFFEASLWISVCEGKLGKLQDFLQGYLVGKRYLLVLDDDVCDWKENHERKMILENVASVGARGSKILVAMRITSLADLPSRVLENIMSRLSVKTLLKCKCVCKTWHTMISDPHFARRHLARATVCPIFRTHDPCFLQRDLHLIEAHSSRELEAPLKIHSKLSLPKHTCTKFGIVNSCDGLLCVCTTPFNNPIYVCNPVTGEYIMLPEPLYNNQIMGEYQMVPEPGGEMSWTRFVFSGFGFCSRTNQYKVMRMLELSMFDEIEPVVQICTLGSGSWETIGSAISWERIGLYVSQRQHLKPRPAPYKSSFSVYLHGAIHWLCNHRGTPMFINSFSFENERFRKVPAPSHFGLYHKQAISNIRMGVLGGCLYMTDVSCYQHFHLWVMKDYGVQESWRKVLVINTLSMNMWPRGLFQPIKYLKNGELLMFHPSNALVYYNPRANSFRYFKIHGIGSDFQMVAHIPSLISIKDAVMPENNNFQILNSRFHKEDK